MKKMVAARRKDRVRRVLDEDRKTEVKKKGQAHRRVIVNEEEAEVEDGLLEVVRVTLGGR